MVRCKGMKLVSAVLSDDYSDVTTSDDDDMRRNRESPPPRPERSFSSEYRAPLVAAPMLCYMEACGPSDQLASLRDASEGKQFKTFLHKCEHP